MGWAVVRPAVLGSVGSVFQRPHRRLLVGLSGAGGQLLLFKALTIGPAYLIFPIVSLSPAVTVLMAFGFLHERLMTSKPVSALLADLGVHPFAFAASRQQ